jgi:hypothetical protein
MIKGAGGQEDLLPDAVPVRQWDALQHLHNIFSGSALVAWQISASFMWLLKGPRAPLAQSTSSRRLAILLPRQRCPEDLVTVLHKVEGDRCLWVGLL